MWSLKWQKKKIIVVQKLALSTDVAAMIALLIAMLLVAVTVAVEKIVKTVVIELQSLTMNGFLGHLLRGYQRNNL